MMKIIKPPHDINDCESNSVAFLAGSIAMGMAEDWQSYVTKKLSDYTDEEVTIYNPRRDEFDATLKQSVHEPILKEQILWELDAMERADYILMYLHPDTMAPITMLELGLHSDKRIKPIVCCPDGFWRQANVEIVCQKYNIPFYKSLDEGIQHLREYLDYDNK